MNPRGQMTSRWPLQPYRGFFFDALLRKSYQFIIVSIAHGARNDAFTCPKGQIPLLGIWGHWYRKRDLRTWFPQAQLLTRAHAEFLQKRYLGHKVISAGSTKRHEQTDRIGLGIPRGPLVGRLGNREPVITPTLPTSPRSRRGAAARATLEHRCPLARARTAGQRVSSSSVQI
jgi:hypothetical protein